MFNNNQLLNNLNNNKLLNNFNNNQLLNNLNNNQLLNNLTLILICISFNKLIILKIKLKQFNQLFNNKFNKMKRLKVFKFKIKKQ